MATINFLLGIICLGIVSGAGMPCGNFIAATPSRNEVRCSRDLSYSRDGNRLQNYYSLKHKKYNDERKRNNANLVIEIARAEIGVREITENSSPRIDEYNAGVGFKKVAWCASFVSFCFRKAGLAQPRTAWSPALFPPGRVAREGLPGMVMGIYFPSMGRIGHCGIVESRRGALYIVIEGNTNVAGGREGDAVMRRIRHRRSIAKFADWMTEKHSALWAY